jgi:hypothetical protein
MLKRRLSSALLLMAILLPMFVPAQSASGSGKVYTAPPEVIEKIKNEGLKNSQVMKHLSYLTDVIGGRLTNSPSMKWANEWTRDTMASWGMQNAKLVAWGPFGRGWTLKRFSAMVTEPTQHPVIAYPKAWSPGTSGPVTAEVVHLVINNDEDFAKYKGKLKGKIVLVSPIRELKADFGGMASRFTDEELAKMAEAPAPEPPRPAPAAQQPQQNPQLSERMRRFLLQAKITNFILEEGAAVMVDNSFNGSGGTVFVQGATVAQELPSSPAQIFARGRLQPYQKEAESKMVPQITLATEDYNRIVRTLDSNVKVKMSVDLAVEYQDQDLMGYNTVAEIPGTDPKLKDEIVMLGGHLDSWHSGTGATDNAAGCAVAMEAARILMALGLKPRRTIRVAL